MKKNRLLTLLVVVLLLPSGIHAMGKEIPFTLDDRDRLIRTEQKVEAVKAEMTARFESVDRRFEAIDKRFDQLFNFLWAIVGPFTAMVVSIFGFAFWDRKLSLAPLKKEDQRILSILVDFAETQPKLKEILRNAGLL
jgi:hypothetical protein